MFGKDTGLGLTTVYGIVHQNSGSITVSMELGSGATFKMYWARHPEETKPAAVASGATKPDLSGTETILLVEDELPLLDLGKRILERLGYTFLTGHVRNLPRGQP